MIHCRRSLGPAPDAPAQRGQPARGYDPRGEKRYSGRDDVVDTSFSHYFPSAESGLLCSPYEREATDERHGNQEERRQRQHRLPPPSPMRELRVPADVLPTLARIWKPPSSSGAAGLDGVPGGRAQTSAHPGGRVRAITGAEAARGKIPADALAANEGGRAPGYSTSLTRRPEEDRFAPRTFPTKRLSGARSP